MDLLLFIESILSLYQEKFNWYMLSIPVVAGIIGWGTNILALKMTFYPYNFIGIRWKGKKIIGWP